MKRLIIYCLVALSIGAVTWMIVKSIHTVQVKNGIKERRETLVDWPIFSLDSVSYKIDFGARPVIVILFNSECEHCQFEARQIRESITSLSAISVLMISSERIAAIEKFSVDYQLANQSAITFCKINPEDMYHTFGHGSIPRILIYGTDHKLIKEFQGAIQFRTILKLTQ